MRFLSNCGASPASYNHSWLTVRSGCLVTGHTRSELQDSARPHTHVPQCVRHDCHQTLPHRRRAHALVTSPVEAASSFFFYYSLLRLLLPPRPLTAAGKKLEPASKFLSTAQIPNVLQHTTIGAFKTEGGAGGSILGEGIIRTCFAKPKTLNPKPLTLKPKS